MTNSTKDTFDDRPLIHPKPFPWLPSQSEDAKEEREKIINDLGNFILSGIKFGGNKFIDMLPQDVRRELDKYFEG